MWKKNKKDKRKKKSIKYCAQTGIDPGIVSSLGEISLRRAIPSLTELTNITHGLCKWCVESCKLTHIQVNDYHS